MEKDLLDLITEEFEEMIFNATENGFQDHSQGVRDALDKFIELVDDYEKSNHITNLACFEQVASVIGRGKAQLELFKARKAIDMPEKPLGVCMVWAITPQGWGFWSKIYKGINPYEQ